MENDWQILLFWEYCIVRGSIASWLINNTGLYISETALDLSPSAPKKVGLPF